MPRNTLPDALAKKLLAKIKRNRLMPVADAIMDSARPSYRVSRTRGSRVKLGASHFGGLPHVPAGFEWPMDYGELMTFVAQINLSELNAGSLGLPEHGWLCFFVGAAEATGSECSVTYIEHDATIAELSPPEGLPFRNEGYPIGIHGKPDDGVFPGTPVKLSIATSVAPLNLDHDQDEDIIDGFSDLCCDLSISLSHVRGNLHWSGDIIDFPEFRKFKDWTLLLQVDSLDPVKEMCWWDNGKLCFLIREHDLAKRRFSKVIAYLAAIG